MANRFGGSDWQVDPSLVAGPTLLASMWSRRYLLALSGIIWFGIGFALSSTQAPVYTATASVFLTDPSDANLFGREVADPERHIQHEASRMQSRTVFERARKIVDDEVGPDDAASAVDISADTQVGLVSITASAGSPRAAASLANAVVAAYEQISREEGAEVFNTARDVLNEQMTELQEQADDLQGDIGENPDDLAASSTLEAVQAQLAALRSRLSEIATEVAIYGAGVDSVEEARPPVEPSSPKPMRDAVVAAMLGVALASAYAYWRASATTATQADVSEILGAPLLAQIPEFKRTGSDEAELIFDVKAIEAYQFLVSSLEYALSQVDGRSVLVTSASPGEGKSLTALHLARALAMQGRNVVLVDSSLHARGLTELLRTGTGEHWGLAELAGGAELGDVVRSYRVSADVRLSFIPAGHSPDPPTGMLSTSAYRNAIERVIDAHELTIIDGDPLLTVADMSSIARQVAGIILVVDMGTPHDALIQVKERLRFIPTPLLGFVANHAGRAVGSVDSRTRARNGGVTTTPSREAVDEAPPQYIGQHHGRGPDEARAR